MKIILHHLEKDLKENGPVNCAIFKAFYFNDGKGDKNRMSSRYLDMIARSLTQMASLFVVIMIMSTIGSLIKTKH